MTRSVASLTTRTCRLVIGETTLMSMVLLALLIMLYAVTVMAQLK